MHRIHKYQLTDQSGWDVIIIGGGATGLGTALDSASRGLKTLLVEQSDFAKGTSSRSTKLVHGGVRYMAQGDIGLVKHALRERGLLELNAKHLVNKEEFIIPCYDWFSVMKYLTGLTLYDWLAGKYSFGKSKFLSKKETLSLMPGIKDKGLKGGIRYFDGKFDDARLAINIAQTAIEQGATLINYMKVTNLIKNKDEVTGVEIEDAITKDKFKINGKVVINATGVFVDEILKMNNPEAKKMVRPSQGVHIVLHKEFLDSNSALMIPKTSDGRVLFAVPWHNHLLVGTTDTPLNEHSLEPRALKEETDFILKTAASYFKTKPTENDILSVFSGLRPLAAPTDSNGSSTKEISRDHKLIVSAKGLITITGGKWTTYRRMAEETVDLAIKEAGLNAAACITKDLKIHGCVTSHDESYLNIYGSDRKHIELLIKENPGFGEKLHPEFPHTVAEVVWSVRNEMAETVEDILSRRLRMLFIDAQAAIEMSEKVASILASELGADKIWEENQIKIFNTLAKGYIYHIEKKEKQAALAS
ncbi:glycerol-3-phosphate dehydrogenase/oxidase [Pedobacter frigiditerrae]|uniref:Glycerol-3-phosphate dehydrogenase/oxidase n=1 Tax=Pedobacter frigiditerrae TaxID=2530452 RepID=A0A4R0MTU5_9SPHI|nr:glycerol-3-phosphate dehydrogenase/oxidase [Pedobacter frigiditerrae]TCC90511.1 glycerol-3-phosphate dehydrogenase/oxidase [Pedobacter frigiditerrae]